MADDFDSLREYRDIALMFSILQAVFSGVFSRRYSTVFANFWREYKVNLKDEDLVAFEKFPKRSKLFCAFSDIRFLIVSARLPPYIALWYSSLLILPAMFSLIVPIFVG